MRRHISAKERMEIFTRCGGICHICGEKIDGTYDAWDVEHVIPIAMGGEDSGDNLAPAHDKCHRAKTRQDMGHIAKAKRMQQRASGIRRQSRSPLPGGRQSRWKKKLSGEVVER